MIGRAAAATLALLVLAGCAPFPAKMVGRFEAERDFILVEKDGWISWSPKGGADGRPYHVGIGAVDGDTPLHVFVVVHSTSSFWPELDFAPDYSKVTIDWGEVREGAAKERSTEFVRVEAP